VHQEFVTRYELPRIPCIITHAMEGWPAATPGSERQWTWASLQQRFSDHKFKARRAARQGAPCAC
jgi:hypothetical protein